MRTLLERLEPEIKEILDAEAIKYPTIVNSIMKALEETMFTSDLRLGTVTDLASVGGLKEHLEVTYSDMYMIHNVQRMFKPLSH